MDARLFFSANITSHRIHPLILLKPRRGIEPPTYSLRRRCSAILTTSSCLRADVLMPVA
jgi:hypothetical protein